MQCSLLSQRSRCGRSRFSPVPAMPSRMLAGNSRVGRNAQYRFACLAIDQRTWTRRRRRRGSLRTPRYRFTPSSSPVPAPLGSDAQRRCSNWPLAFRQEADRRNKFAYDAGRALFRIRLCSPVQRSHSQRLSSNSNADPRARAPRSRPGAQSIFVSPPLPPAIQLEERFAVPRATRRAWRRIRRQPQL